MSQRFTELCDALLNQPVDVSQNFSLSELIEIITQYVHEIELDPNMHELHEQIRSAPDLINVRVYQYESGAGKATRQFYAFAKAITYYLPQFQTRLTRQKILEVLMNYLQNQM